MAPELFLVVGGRRYEGWKSIRVTRSIESLAGSFALEVSDRWATQDEPWPIAEEDACRVEIGDERSSEVIIDGYVDARDLSLSATSRPLSYSGRDRAGALVDCSAVLTRWTYRNVTLADFAATLAAPFNVSVTVQAGLTLSKIPKIVVHPGDTPYEVMQREASAAGVLLVSDGRGGVRITRSGTRAGVSTTSLVEGHNILTGSVRYDGTDRFHRYVIATQVGGTDAASGEATRILAEAIDEGVRRTDRVLMIRPDKGYSVADARKRADWEARIRAARAETVTIGVQGWRQPTGALWPVNALTHVRSKKLGVNGTLLISQVEYSISEGGQVTTLNLVRPDAFTPEPRATVKPTTGSTGSGGDAWKALAGGGL